MSTDWRTSRLTMCGGFDDPGVRCCARRHSSRRLFDPDEAAIGVQAMVVRAGGTLYTDIYDRKPPLPPLLYAASFSLTDSTDIRLIRVLVTIMLAAAGILVALECLRRWGPSPRVVGRGAVDRRCDGPVPGRRGSRELCAFRVAARNRGHHLGAARHAPHGARCRRGDRHRHSVPAKLAAGRRARLRQHWAPRPLAQRPRIRGRRSCNGRHNRLLRTPRPVLGMERDRQPGLRVRRHRASGRRSAAVWRPSPGSPHSTLS